jgi:hypothetical protein
MLDPIEMVTQQVLARRENLAVSWLFHDDPTTERRPKQQHGLDLDPWQCLKEVRILDEQHSDTMHEARNVLGAYMKWQFGKAPLAGGRRPPSGTPGGRRSHHDWTQYRQE